jgi:hypothetical protein
MEEPLYLIAQHLIFSLVKENGKSSIQWNDVLMSGEAMEELRKIHVIYDDRYFIWLNDNRKKLLPKKQRTCRFCGKSYPTVKFSNKAHKIPELIGNKYHFSDFECDNCNRKFGIFENDFAKYLGMYRTFAELEGKKGVPKYKSRDRSMEIEQAFENTFDLNINDILNPKNKILYNSEKQISGFLSEGEPYIPLNVFKCLLKSAISFVDEEDLTYLTSSIKFLFDAEFTSDASNNFIFGLHQYFVPGNFKIPPFLIQYNKGANYIDFPAPSIFFVFYIKNLIIQLFIPFHDKDFFIYKKDAERHLYVLPPLICNDWFKKFGGPFPSYVNLNDNQQINNIQFQEWK